MNAPRISPTHSPANQLKGTPAMNTYLDSIIADENYAYAIEKLGEEAVRDKAFHHFCDHYANQY